MELNLEGLEMQKWNILTDMDQRLDEKNVVIYLVIKFALRIMVINISKIAHFMFFFPMTAQKQSQFGQNI